MASLAIYRRSLAPPTAAPFDAANLPPLSDLGVDAEAVPSKGSKGYGWSRWWRRAQTTDPAPIGDKPTPVKSAEAKLEPPAEVKTSEKAEQTEAEKVKAEVVAGQVSPPLELPLTCKTSDAVDSAAKPMHYAKTLRLSSDQLVGLLSWRH